MHNPATLAAVFRDFAPHCLPGSPLYHDLALRIAADAALIALAAHTRPGQPPPNMLLAAVHDLLYTARTDRLLGRLAEPGSGSPDASVGAGAAAELQGAAALAAFYPSLGGAALPGPTAFAAFRAFCLANTAAITPLLASRLTQTNETQRCAYLLPAFQTIFAQSGAPLALIEIGPSAGLNLNWDRYAYTYHSAQLPTGQGQAAEEAGAGLNPHQRPGQTAVVDYHQPSVTLGAPTAPVQIYAALRGPPWPPLPAQLPPVAWRIGVDLSPVNLDDPHAVRWLAALVWPEDLERRARLAAAIGVARAHPPPIVAGDALALLPALIARAPAEAALCIYHTHVTYQFSPSMRAQLDALIVEAAQARPIYRLACESFDSAAPALSLTVYQQGRRDTRLLATTTGHAHWIAWYDT